MTFDQVLEDLLTHTDRVDGWALLSWGLVQSWPEGALDCLVRAGLLVNGSHAQSIECVGCENHCFMDVAICSDEHGALSRAFIICDVPEMQGQMGRINVPMEHLQQWITSPRHLAEVISGLLGFDRQPEYLQKSDRFSLGMIKGKNGRRAVSLIAKPLSLEVNQHSAPIREVLYFEKDVLVIDRLRIESMAQQAPKESKSYLPSTDKREAGKLATQEMYQDWNDEYLKLKKSNTGKSDTWIAIQIAKLPIAQGKDSETIRKNMKF